MAIPEDSQDLDFEEHIGMIKDLHGLKVQFLENNEKLEILRSILKDE